MSMWDQIRHFMRDVAANGFMAFFERLRGDAGHSVAFTMAVVALGAKMAKADGRVTHDEVAAFREVYRADASAEQDIARLFNLARQDTAGFEAYAQRIKRLFPSPDHAAVSDLIEGLFYIAMADGHYHPGEDAFLTRVAEILGIPQAKFRTIRARAVPGQDSDPHTVLGVAPSADFAQIQRTWKKLVRECHPDAVQARGLPPEAIGIAERRLIAINRAWDEIKRGQMVS
ncbi:MAG: molecular chaperone DjiA [Deltaproteobacteria bacterium]